MPPGVTTAARYCPVESLAILYHCAVGAEVCVQVEPVLLEVQIPPP